MHPQMTRKPPFSSLFRHKETGPITDTLYQLSVQLWCGRRDSNPHTTEVTEPKSVESTNSTTPADMSGRASCRYFVTLYFYTVREPRRSLMLDPRL